MICFIVTANDKIYYIDNLKETRVKLGIYQKLYMKFLKRGASLREVASIEWDNLVVCYYLSASKIWCDEMGGLGGRGLIRGGLL
jgi:hypothetical protein